MKSFSSAVSEETSGFSSEASWGKGFRANETGEISFGGQGGAWLRQGDGSSDLTDKKKYVILLSR